MMFAEKRVALYGSFLERSRAQACAELEKRGSSVERDLTRRTDVFVVGRGALAFVPGGHLQEKLNAATAQSIPILGEKRIWSAIDDKPEPKLTYPLTKVVPTPPDGLAQMLHAFDIVQVSDECCGFGDVDLFRTAMRLLDEGHDVSAVIRIMISVRDVAPRGRHKIVSSSGDARLQWDDAVTELDGQGVLPLPDHPNLDDVFERAMFAEAEGLLEDAVTLYETCTQMDKRDPIAPFNLGNVLFVLGRNKEAERRYSQAIARDAKFSEAYYNRARLHEEVDDGSAERDLRAALAQDPAYSDALFNLAQLRLRLGDAREALGLFDRFLDLAQDPDWQKIASKARALAAKKLRMR